MEISELREFVVLAEELNYSAAADRLFLSKSSLTKHIQSVESEVGVRLFDRDNRSVSLTQAGAVFLERAEGLLERYNAALEAARAVAANEATILRVGYLFETAGETLPQACADFVRACDARLSLRAMEVEEIREGVVKGGIDLGLTTVVSDDIPPECECLRLAEDEFGVVVPSSSRLAAMSSLRLSDLDGMTLFGPHPHHLPAEAKVLNRHLAQSKSNIRLIAEIVDIGSIRPALTMGADAVFALGHASDRFGRDFAFVPLCDVEAKPMVALIWRKGAESEALRSFASCIKTLFEEHRAG